MNAATSPLPRNRENTRTRLIAAGRRLFYTRDYHAISVDLIAREAGFTRAAFYLHFTGKDDLLAAMMIAESHLSDALFQWFERDPPTAASIDGFIRAIITSNRASPASRLFHLAALQSAPAGAAFQANRLRLMAVLGVGFPAFRAPRDGSAAEQSRFAEALFAIIQIEQLGVREAAFATPALAEAMVRVLRDHLCDLHARYPAA